VEDATRAERNPELKAPKTKHKKGGHHILATIMWTLVVFVTIVAVLFLVLLVTGGDLTSV
jgi:heme/copper-type cytochrome/quinol oxidase subunit 2